MPTITGMPKPNDPDRERGVYDKFLVERMDTEAAERHRDCFFFVLDLTHDILSIPALETYIAAARQHGYHKLAHDLREKLDELHGIGGIKS